MHNVRASSQIQRNVRAHDRVARLYRKRHGEIYNAREQGRLRRELSSALACVETGSKPPVVLDFGSGAGNLTEHMLELGCDVIAADVSSACLDLIMEHQKCRRVSPFLLNGVDLEGLADNSMDMVVTYSVLHHVPAYLDVLSEFVRVLKPGGVVFIDHELSELHWNPDELHREFKRQVSDSMRPSLLTKYLTPQNYVNWFMCKFVDSRYRPEGDIHVFPDDHVEWEKVIAELVRAGAEVVHHKKYLLYRAGYDEATYDAYASKTHDMEMVIARKPKTSVHR